MSPCWHCSVCVQTTRGPRSSSRRLELTGTLRRSAGHCKLMCLADNRVHSGIDKPGGGCKNHLLIQVVCNARPRNGGYTDVCTQRPMHVVVQSAEPRSQCREAVKESIEGDPKKSLSNCFLETKRWPRHSGTWDCNFSRLSSGRVQQAVPRFSCNPIQV